MRNSGLPRVNALAAARGIRYNISNYGKMRGMNRRMMEQTEPERPQGSAAEQAQYRKMTETPVPKLVIALALPTIASMLVTALYNMADTYFVSQLGTSASGAVGIVFSLMAIIQAIGFTFGTGSASLIARRLGERDVEAATTYLSSAFFAALEASDQRLFAARRYSSHTERAWCVSNLYMYCSKARAAC